MLPSAKIHSSLVHRHIEAFLFCRKSKDFFPTLLKHFNVDNALAWYGFGLDAVHACDSVETLQTNSEFEK